MMKTPFYLLWVILCLGYLSMANLRGWSLIHTLSPRNIFSQGNSGFHHK